LSGTNSEEGLRIINDFGLPSVSTMSQVAKKAIELSRK
jgi:succinyl-CoA synthetase beta subunit